jgi:hypothetical protein
VDAEAVGCQIHDVGGWHALKGRGSSKTASTTPFQGVPPSGRSDIVNLRLNKLVSWPLTADPFLPLSSTPETRHVIGGGACCFHISSLWGPSLLNIVVRHSVTRTTLPVAAGPVPWALAILCRGRKISSSRVAAANTAEGADWRHSLHNRRCGAF